MQAFKSVFKSMSLSLLYIAFLLILSALESTSARADSLYTGAWSYHADRQWDMTNANHKLLAYSTDNYVIGRFTNSYDEVASFVGVELIERQYGNINLQAYAVALYGYRNCTGYRQGDSFSYVNGKFILNKYDKRTCAKVTATASYTKYAVQPSIIFLGDVVAIAVKWEFK